MNIFESENEQNENQENQENNENTNNQNQSEEEQEKNKQEENQNGLDGDYDFDDYSMDEQLVDTDSEKQSSESVVQRVSIDSVDKSYNIYTSEFDETVEILVTRGLGAKGTQILMLYILQKRIEKFQIHYSKF
jgi:cobaltochelatase CobT